MACPKPCQKSAQYICSCKYTRNFFLCDLKLHVTYEDEKQFFTEYNDILKHAGYVTREDHQAILHEINKELNRRKSSALESWERRGLIKQKYKAKHPKVYCLQESLLSPEFINLVRKAKEPNITKTDLIKNLRREKAPDVYSFKVFTPEFTNALIEEIQHFEGSDLPKARPNTMNNYGVLLGEMGFDDRFLDPLRELYLMPLAKVLYPDYVGKSLDSHRAFIVTYKAGKDLDLSYHYDNAEVTLNVSLGKDFTGGDLYFGDVWHKTIVHGNEQYFQSNHEPTYGILHRGQHMHGAMPIEDGERYNMIIWMRSSSVRNNCCPMCSRKPNLIPVPCDGDGFTMPEVEVCNVF